MSVFLVDYVLVCYYRYDLYYKSSEYTFWNYHIYYLTTSVVARLNFTIIRFHQLIVRDDPEKHEINRKIAKLLRIEGKQVFRKTCKVLESGCLLDLNR
jgi:hypothetical protein